MEEFQIVITLQITKNNFRHIKVATTEKQSHYGLK